MIHFNLQNTLYYSLIILIFTVDYKPTSLAVDWISGNLYWSEVEQLAVPEGVTPYGQIMMSKSDGRYRRSIVKTNLEQPTSVVVDPERGELLWADAGNQPKIEIAWMDGDRRKLLVAERIASPSALTIDYAMEHTLYWSDVKLDIIEAITLTGNNRRIVLRGAISLKHPVALDVFENNLYWVTKQTGELIRQDKFGRGVPHIITKNLPSPGGLRVYHQLRYNTSLRDPCHNDQCSHLCVTIPGGHRCLCSDSVDPLQRLMRDNERHCDATNERPLPSPRICRCQNGGRCQEEADDKLTCNCREEFHGEFCEMAAVAARASGSTAAIVIPIVICLLVLFCAVAIFMVLKKRPL